MHFFNADLNYFKMTAFSIIPEYIRLKTLEKLLMFSVSMTKVFIIFS